VPLSSVRSFDLVSNREIAGIRASLARTGYTAEDGFEIFCDAADADTLWQRLLEAAAGAGGKPIGLGARDTLRLEGRLSLYGNDLTDETTPLEAGLGWVVKLDGAADFIGKAALREQKARGVARKLVGFVMRGRGVARHGYPIRAHSGGESSEVAVGTVTSGTYGPTVDKNIGMGYVPTSLSAPGSSLVIDCRGKMIEAEIVSGPFYKRPR
jgi:aminomethyltransferase